MSLSAAHSQLLGTLHGVEHSSHTLQTTALVNETYLRLVGCGQVNWKDRALRRS